jgi:hypothetical protein
MLRRQQVHTEYTEYAPERSPQQKRNLLQNGKIPAFPPGFEVEVIGFEPTAPSLRIKAPCRDTTSLRLARSRLIWRESAAGTWNSIAPPDRHREAHRGADRHVEATPCVLLCTRCANNITVSFVPPRRAQLYRTAVAKRPKSGCQTLWTPAVPTADGCAFATMPGYTETLLPDALAWPIDDRAALVSDSLAVDTRAG